MRDKSVFFPDDLDRINSKYFSQLRKENKVLLDPSYWYKNYTQAALEFGYNEIKNYKSDYHDSLKLEKPLIVDTISKWDETLYNYDDMTICSSTTSGSIILLAYLKEVFKIENIFFETPCYFASLKQAELLNFNVTMLPTYFKNDFTIDVEAFKDTKRKIIWLTQPRYGLGSNYDVNVLKEILSICGKNDFIIIDEATEQLFPSHLSEYNFQYDERIIKLRTPFKGIGINGPRLSMIIHGSLHRKRIQNTLEEIQGAMDVFSLDFANKVFSDQDKYFAMLGAANNQVKNTYNKLLPRTIGSKLTLSEINNGYIASVFMTYENNSFGYAKRREKLLQYCAENNMPIILGSTLCFAKDRDREQIRLNYFNTTSDLINAINILESFTF